MVAVATGPDRDRDPGCPSQRAPQPPSEAFRSGSAVTCLPPCRSARRDQRIKGRWPGGGQGEQLIRDHGGRRFTIQGCRAGLEHLRLEHGPALPDLLPAAYSDREQPSATASRSAGLQTRGAAFAARSPPNRRICALLQRRCPPQKQTKYSAGRLWIMLPGPAYAFRDGSGVGSGLCSPWRQLRAGDQHGSGFVARLGGVPGRPGRVGAGCWRPLGPSESARHRLPAGAVDTGQAPGLRRQAPGPCWAWNPGFWRRIWP